MITLVRPPVIFPKMAVGNEATPSLGLAYIAGYLRKHGYEPIIIDGMAGALNKVWALEKYPGYQCQGFRFSEIIDRIPKETKIVGISAMFSGEWDMSMGMKQETVAATYLSVKGNQKAPLPAAYNEDRQHLE